MEFSTPWETNLVNFFFRGQKRVLSLSIILYMQFEKISNSNYPRDNGGMLSKSTPRDQRHYLHETHVLRLPVHNLRVTQLQQNAYL